MVENDEDKFIRRCLELASKAEGLTYPNPMVGSVIVNEGRIIGEGYHLRSGEPHAEVNAINSVTDKKKLESSALYVNLEPCSHFGKTPPCADYIIANKIPRIIVGTQDTSDKVAGEGIKKLTEAGCDVKYGILEDDCRKLNKRFFTFHEKRRPYIILKWAQSADGFLDIIRKNDQMAEPNWITGNPEKILVHKWRSVEQSILVGAGTVRADAPQLNVREWTGHNPMRLILSSSGVFTDWLNVNKARNPTVVFTHNETAEIHGTTKVVLNKDVPSSRQVCEYLYSNGIQSLFVEGGAEVLNHFIKEGLWDEARIFKGTDCFNNGIKAPFIKSSPFSKTVFSGSILEIYLRH